MSKPGTGHWIGVKRVFRYIKGTLDYGLIHSAKDNNTQIVGYADADWTGDVNTRKSTSGYVFKIGGSTISWMSKRQSIVALLTTEAEYVALLTATQEVIWLCSLLKVWDSNKNSRQPSLRTIKDRLRLRRTLSDNHEQNTLSWNITLPDAIIKGETQLTYCPTSIMIADILTKPIPRHQLEELRKKLGVAKLWLWSSSGSIEMWRS